MSDIIDKPDPAPGPPSPTGITPRTSVKDLQGDPTNPSNQALPAPFVFIHFRREIRILHPFGAFAMDD